MKTTPTSKSIQQDRKARLKRYLPRLLVTYLVMLVLPIVFGSIAYRSAQAAIARNSEESRLAALRQVLTTLDFTIDEVRGIANAVSLNPTIRRFAYLEDPYAGVNPIRAIETLEEFRKFNVRDPLVLDFFVVMATNDVVVGPQRVSRISQFYPDLFAYKGWTREEWQRQLFSGEFGRRFFPVRDIIVTTADFSVLSYVQPFPFSINQTGAVVVLLDAERIESIVMRLGLSSQSELYIVDDRGVVIAAYGARPTDEQAGETEVDAGEREAAEARQAVGPNRALETNRLEVVPTAQGDMVVARVVSPDTGWSIASVEPVSVVMGELASIQRTTAIVVAATLLLGGALGAGLAYQNIKPVRLLLEDNQALRSAQIHHLPFLRQAFLERLFRGEFRLEEEARRIMHELGIDLDGAGFCVAMVQLAHAETRFRELSYAETQRERLVLSDLVEKSTEGHQAITHEIAGDSLAILVVAERASNDERSYPQIIDHIYHEAETRLPRLGTWAVGRWHEGMLDIARSFQEARAALSHVSSRDANGIVSYDEIPRRTDGYAYPADVENRLIGLVSSGNTEDALALVSTLITENVESRHPDSVVSRLFAFDLLSTVLKIIDSHTIRDESLLERLRERVSGVVAAAPSAVCDEARRVMQELSESVATTKRSHNTRLIQDIERYLEENYTRPEMGLYAVASHFDISETYLSHFFKEQSGINFGTRLQDLRLRAAVNLLETSEVPVKEIASRVGYGTYTTFARVFRSTYGLSASEYRESRGAR